MGSAIMRRSTPAKSILTSICSSFFSLSSPAAASCGFFFFSFLLFFRSPFGESTSSAPSSPSLLTGSSSLSWGNGVDSSTASTVAYTPYCGSAPMRLVLAQPEPSATSVLAKKYRCLPSRLQDGELVSAIPSVSGSRSRRIDRPDHDATQHVRECLGVREPLGVGRPRQPHVPRVRR